MEIRRLVIDSEVAHPVSEGTGGITFSGSSLSSKVGSETPRLLRRPTSLKKPAG